MMSLFSILRNSHLEFVMSLNLSKGRTIRKVMGGGGAKSKKNSRAREN